MRLHQYWNMFSLQSDGERCSASVIININYYQLESQIRKNMNMRDFKQRYQLLTTKDFL